MSDEVKTHDGNKINLNLILCGKREIVIKEFNKAMDSMQYDNSSDNLTITRITNLVEHTLDMYTESAVVQLIVNVQPTKDEKLVTRTVEVAVRPLWGYCE